MGRTQIGFVSHTPRRRGAQKSDLCTHRCRGRTQIGFEYAHAPGGKTKVKKRGVHKSDLCTPRRRGTHTHRIWVRPGTGFDANAICIRPCRRRGARRSDLRTARRRVSCSLCWWASLPFLLSAPRCPAFPSSLPPTSLPPRTVPTIPLPAPGPTWRRRMHLILRPERRRQADIVLAPRQVTHTIPVTIH